MDGEATAAERSLHEAPKSDAAETGPPATPRSRRRYLQFSIRGLLVFTALVAVPLGWFVNHFERPRRAVAAIEALGGSFKYGDSMDRPGAVERWLRGKFPKSYFDPVISVSLGSHRITDDDLVHLAGLTSVQRLYLRETQITDAGLSRLTGLTTLRCLYLGDTRVTDAGLAQLAGLRAIRALDLHGTRVTSAGLARLTGLTSMQELDLSDTQVDDSGLAKLAELKSLEYLDLCNTRVTNAGLKHLAGLSTLQSLSLRGTRVTDAGVQELQRGRPNCSIYRY